MNNTLFFLFRATQKLLTLQKWFYVFQLFGFVGKIDKRNMAPDNRHRPLCDTLASVPSIVVRFYFFIFQLRLVMILDDDENKKKGHSKQTNNSSIGRYQAIAKECQHQLLHLQQKTRKIFWKIYFLSESSNDAIDIWLRLYWEIAGEHWNFPKSNIPYGKRHIEER